MSTDLPSVDEMHVRRFERARAEEVAARLRAQAAESPADGWLIAKHEAKAAAARGDTPVFVGACDAWREVRVLPAAYSRSFVRALIAEARFEEALAVLKGGRIKPKDGAYYHDLALALIGRGRLGAALVAAIKAQAGLTGQEPDETRLEWTLADLTWAATPLDRAARWPVYRAATGRQSHYPR